MSGPTTSATALLFSRRTSAASAATLFENLVSIGVGAGGRLDDVLLGDNVRAAAEFAEGTGDSGDQVLDVGSAALSQADEALICLHRGREGIVRPHESSVGSAAGIAQVERVGVERGS